MQTCGAAYDTSLPWGRLFGTPKQILPFPGPYMAGGQRGLTALAAGARKLASKKLSTRCQASRKMYSRLK